MPDSSSAAIASVAVESLGGLVRVLGGGLLAVGVALAYPPGR